jgi:hypothetical protein
VEERLKQRVSSAGLTFESASSMKFTAKRSILAPARLEESKTTSRKIRLQSNYRIEQQSYPECQTLNFLTVFSPTVFPLQNKSEIQNSLSPKAPLFFT